MKNLFVVVFAFSSVVAAENFTGRHLGVTLPNGSKKIGEDRFVSSRSYEDTVKEMTERFRRSSIKPIGEEINLPHVRATFFADEREKPEFQTINIYLNTQSEVTNIFFVRK